MKIIPLPKGKTVESTNEIQEILKKGMGVQDALSFGKKASEHDVERLGENIKDNSFFTFDKKGWKGKYTYKYKLIQDLKILLTITNNTIKDNKLPITIEILEKKE